MAAQRWIVLVTQDIALGHYFPSKEAALAWMTRTGKGLGVEKVS